MEGSTQVIETRRGVNGLEVLIEDPTLTPQTVDYLESHQVSAVFFDEDEFTSGVIKHRYQPTCVKNRIRTLLALRKVPIVNWFVTGDHVKYESIRYEVSELMRKGVAESGDGDSLNKLLNGLKESGEDVVNGADPTFISPRFIAMTTIALRSRLGRLEPTRANQLTLSKEYTRLCNHRCVRASIEEHNRSLVMECFFKEDVLDRLTTRYSRLPKWLEWAVWWSRSDEPALQRYT